MKISENNSRALILLFFLFVASGFYAQSLSISGMVLDANGQPVEAAVVNLLNASDSTLVKAELTDMRGDFVFSQIDTGVYWLSVYTLGYERYSSELILASQPGERVVVKPLELLASTTALQELTITAKKPFIERRTDRTIVNVAGGILSSGSSALDVLERSPGVLVSSNDAISMRGRSGVIVMIDGKPNPMSGADLSNFLRSMPSNSIERIELITNPSAKYDAAGNAGIIDIRMKKEKNLGTNGAFSMDYGQGVYPKAGGGINLNHRSKMANMFGSYNYSYRKAMNDLRLYRVFYENGLRTSAYDQRNYLILPFKRHSARVGTDFYPNKKTTIGLLATGNYRHFNPRAQNTSAVEDGDTAISSYFATSNRSRDRWLSWSANANFNRRFNEKGHEISMDLDYANFGNDTEQNFTTSYTSLSGETLKADYLLFGDLQGNLKIRSIKADYTLPLAEKAKFEAGLKASIVDADNDLQFYDRSIAGTSVFDSLNSNHFIYKENINAAYLNLSREWTRFSTQAGLRVENTIATGTQLVNGENFDRNYTNLFPSLFFNYKHSKNYETSLNFSRRLDRPSYRQLNPFRKFLDPSTYSAGNPFLNPQFTWSAEWNQTLWQKLNITVSASRTTDHITQVIAPVGGLDRVTVQTDSNLATVDFINLDLNYNFNITKWWSTVNNFNTWRSQYSGMLANTSLRDGNLVAHIMTSHNFKINNDWRAELNFNYTSHQIYGFMDLNPQWGLGVGLQKSVFGQQGTLKLAIRDIFWKNLPSATIRFNDYIETFEVFRETRLATLSFNYRFGRKEISGARRRQGGAEEEKRRAG